MGLDFHMFYFGEQDREARVMMFYSSSVVVHSALKKTVVDVYK